MVVLYTLLIFVAAAFVLAILAPLAFRIIDWWWNTVEDWFDR